MSVHICSFESGPEVKRTAGYEELKAAVLLAGKFSAFEATANKRAAAFYDRLCRDQELEIGNKLGYPWTSVKIK